jgi:hypothetical protein
VPATLRLIARNYPGVSGGWANMIYVGAQAQAPAVQAQPAAAGSAQYVVNKLHLLEAHRITSGDGAAPVTISVAGPSVGGTGHLISRRQPFQLGDSMNRTSCADAQCET